MGTSLVALLFTLSTILRADGGMVKQTHFPMVEPSQEALLYFHEGREILVLRVEYKDADGDFAWVVPLPKEPKVSLVSAEDDPFEALNDAVNIALGNNRGDSSLRPPPGTALSPGRSKSTVHVLQRDMLGPYEMVVLHGEGESVNRWLNKNGFRITAKMGKLLSDYSTRGWIFTVMRLKPGNVPAGPIQTLKFEFPTSKPIYPLKISAANAGLSDILVYALSKDRLVPKDPEHWPRLNMDASLGIGRFGQPESIYPERPLGQMFKASAGDPKGSTPAAQVYWPGSSAEEGRHILEDHFLIPAVEFGNRSRLRNVSRLLGIEGNIKLYLIPFRGTFSAAEMDQDLWFQPLGPPFWRAIGNAGALEGGNPELKMLALTALDSTRAEAAALSSNAEQRKIAVALYLDRLKPETQLKLAVDPNPAIREFMAASTSSTPGALEEMTAKIDYSIWELLLKNPNLKASGFVNLVKNSRDDSFTRRVLLGPELPVEAFYELAKSKDVMLRSQLLQNPTCPKSLLSYFANSDDPSNWNLVATDPRLSPKDLRAILKKTFPNNWINSGIYNPNLTKEDLIACPSALEALDFFAKKDLASKTKSPELLAYFSQNEDSVFRTGAAGNPKLSGKQFNSLSHDKESSVRKWLLMNPVVPTDIVEALSRDESSSVRAQAASITNDVEMLRRFSNDLDEDVRESVAYNSKSPADLVLSLCKDQSVYVRGFVAAIRKDLDPSQLDLLLKDPEPHVRKALAGREDLRPAEIKVLAEDRDSSVRLAVAKNATSPPGILEALSHDKDPEVRRNAVELMTKRKEQKK